MRAGLSALMGSMSVAIGVAQAAQADICAKPLAGSWRTVREITTDGTGVGITDEDERRALHATATFSGKVVRYAGRTCHVAKRQQTRLSPADLDAYYRDDKVMKSYPLHIDITCAGQERGIALAIGRNCDEIVSTWDGADFLMKPARPRR